MPEIPTYDWKYLICPKGEATWGEFAEHGTFPTAPSSNRDFDCTRVAEDIARHIGADDDATICLEDPHGNRYEVDVTREEAVRYDSVGYRELGKSTQVKGDPKEEKK
jgi:hypothetical protein